MTALPSTEDLARFVDPSLCPFCGRDPYHYVDIGVGMERAAVECCDLGIALFQYRDEQISEVAGMLAALASEVLDRTLGAKTEDQAIADWNRRAALCASGQQVRALEWDDFDGQGAKATAMLIASYLIARLPDGRFEISVSAPGYSTGFDGERFHPTLEAAKAAAQADYERHILAALTPAPQPAGEAQRDARSDIGILLAQIDWLQECLGETLESEDAALVDQIRADWTTTPSAATPTAQEAVPVAEVLKPFANMINHIETDTPDDYHPSWAEFLTVGDFRRAAAALRALKGGDATPAAQEAEPVEGELDEAWKSGFNAGFGEAMLTAHPPRPSVSVAEAGGDLVRAMRLFWEADEAADECRAAGKDSEAARYDKMATGRWQSIPEKIDALDAALRALKGEE